MRTNSYAAPINLKEDKEGALELLFGLTESAAKDLPFFIAKKLLGQTASYFLGPISWINTFADMAQVVGGKITMENDLKIVHNGSWLENSVWDVYHKAPSGAELSIVALTSPARDSGMGEATNFASEIVIEKDDSRGPAFYEHVKTIKVLENWEGLHMLSDYALIPKETLKLPDGKYVIYWGNMTYPYYLEIGTYPY